MKYEETSHKIRKNWKSVHQNDSEINKLNKISDKFYSSRYSKNQYLYETDWTIIADNTNFTKVTLQFENFPDELVPYIKPILLFKTDDIWLEAENTDFNWDFKYCLEQSTNEDETKTILIIYTFIKGLFTQNSTTLPLYYKILISIINTKEYNEIRTNKAQN